MANKKRSITQKVKENLDKVSVDNIKVKLNLGSFTSEADITKNTPETDDANDKGGK
ncbi:hypothetical protein MNBD_CHLOROFLEXI01-1336 [hydrothermal vent metagenome]|uniref:Uncharacterized protein n=1 Tax=hydrothermal vent metagenome TaxID=652676 RepID=A0A3B0VYS6_9ZZZZ